MVTQSQINRLQRFYECHRQALFTYALSLTGQSVEAEDLLHNVFAKLLDKEASNGVKAVCLPDGTEWFHRRSTETKSPAGAFV